ncbi:MAG: UDP-3-O-acyl-N-acetylglucosamine deacetylase [Deltaproteobacteria bacterium]
MRRYQHTIAEPVEFSGVGLHTGVSASARILPAPADTGILFRRTDIGAEIPATVDHVVETAFATVLGQGEAKLSTVEHFLAALYGMEIDNAVVEVDAPELPILDGSALAIARAIDTAGAASQPERRRFLRVYANDRIRRNGSLIALSPSTELEILVTVDFPDTAIGRQWAKFTLSPEAFLREIAPSRTFVLRHQIEALRSAGLARGGSLDNAIVVEGDTVHNTEGLRFPDEFARHKLLDFLGDIALLGRPLRGAFVAVRPGHTVNNALAEYLATYGSSRVDTPCVTAGELPEAIPVTA